MESLPVGHLVRLPSRCGRWSAVGAIVGIAIYRSNETVFDVSGSSPEASLVLRWTPNRDGIY
jgi:hypothetical protein